MIMSDLITVNPEVADALRDGAPIVALESSGIPHGFKYPMNREVALDTEQAVRKAGAIPARVAIIDGKFVVGLTEEQTELLASTPNVKKAATRDVGPVLATGKLGATTVSASLLAASKVGIKVFAVAGIGGVHFNAQQTFDISSDLVEFTRHKVAVVCAGAKTVLDPALTLEYMETIGLPVVGYRCDNFPAYYSVDSGQPNPSRIDDLDQIAKAIRFHWAAGNNGGFVVTHPISEADGMPSEEAYALVKEKLAEADAAGVSGPAVTPYVLKAVSAATKGATADANRSVLLSTAAVAGELAVAVAAEFGVSA